jgi:hypothetical protein
VVDRRLGKAGALEEEESGEERDHWGMRDAGCGMRDAAECATTIKTLETGG